MGFYCDGVSVMAIVEDKMGAEVVTSTLKRCLAIVGHRLENKGGVQVVVNMVGDGFVAFTLDQGVATVQVDVPSWGTFTVSGVVKKGIVGDCDQDVVDDVIGRLDAYLVFERKLFAAFEGKPL